MQNSLACGETDCDGGPVFGKHVTQSVERRIVWLGTDKIDIKLLEATDPFLDVRDQSNDEAFIEVLAHLRSAVLVPTTTSGFGFV